MTVTHNKNLKLWLVIGLTVIASTIGTGFYHKLSADNAETYKGLKIFSDVIELIQKNYVDPVARIFDMSPPQRASGVTCIAARILPDAPDIRPSVTSATLKPRFCNTPRYGVSLCNSGIPLARGP